MSSCFLCCFYECTFLPGWIRMILWHLTYIEDHGYSDCQLNGVVSFFVLIELILELINGSCIRTQVNWSSYLLVISPHPSWILSTYFWHLLSCQIHELIFFFFYLEERHFCQLKSTKVSTSSNVIFPWGFESLPLPEYKDFGNTHPLVLGCGLR